MQNSRESKSAVRSSSGPSRNGCRSETLLDILSEYEASLIVTHDNPDPDAIATGWAIHDLIEQKLSQPVQLIGGGGIVRAENRHMVELLDPPIRLVPSLEIPPDVAAILVDCEAGGTNQLLTRQGLKPVAVIDHHGVDGAPIPVRFRDVRPDVVACATIAGNYLREQHVDPGPKLATAMLYAMRTETRGEEFSYSALDRTMLMWLTERAEPSLLAEIESAPLAIEYFGDLVLALQNTFVYGRTGLCLLPRAEGAEIVGEMADLLIRCQGISRVLCAALVDEDLYISVRTECDLDNAAELVRRTLAGLGGGGGHRHRAGGRIARVHQMFATRSWETELGHRWLAVCGDAEKQPRRLVPKHEIISHLENTAEMPTADLRRRSS